MNIEFREKVVNTIYGVLQTLSTQLQSASRDGKSTLVMSTLIRRARTDLNSNLKSVLSQYTYESPKSSTTKRLVNEVLGKKKIDKDDGNFMINVTQKLVENFDIIVSSFGIREYSKDALFDDCSKHLYKLTIQKLQKYGNTWLAKRVTLASFVAFVDSLK